MKIELKAASKSFKSIKALEDFSVVFEPGQIIAVLGANGAGKTTLLRALCGIVALNSGEIQFDGETFVRGRMDLRRRLFFMPDFPPLFGAWPLLRHIGMVLKLYEVHSGGMEDRVMELLKDFDLLPLIDTPMAQLSRGQRYKVALTAMIAVNAELWLLDEPLASGMDPSGLNAFKRHARNAVANEGRLILYSTQILDAAERFSDRVCVIHRGQMRAFEKTENLRQGSNQQGGALDELFAQLREEDAR
jgi:ABC-type multidrug transport system ATPase subunit